LSTSFKKYGYKNVTADLETANSFKKETKTNAKK